MRNSFRSCRHLLAQPKLKYQFIAAHQQEYSITLMCRVLEVSVSGYYAWNTRPVSAHQREDARLAAEIQTIFLDHRRVYGSPRIHAALQTRGLRCGRKRVVRLMQTLGLQAKPHHQRKPITTSSDPTAQFAPNLLNRDFTATRPNSKWVTDITAIPTAEGWMYLAVVLDLFSRMIVGWAMDGSENEHLVTMALQMAFARRHPQAGLLHHSDRGCEYTSLGYRALLATLGIEVSMSRTANCYDNAVMESFFDTLKSECVHRTHFTSRQQARGAIDLRTWNVSTTRCVCIQRDSMSVHLLMSRRLHNRCAKPTLGPPQIWVMVNLAKSFHEMLNDVKMIHHNLSVWQTGPAGANEALIGRKAAPYLGDQY